MFAVYRQILSHPGALRLCVAGFIARLPIPMMSVGFIFLIHSRYDSYAHAGVVAGAFFLGTTGGTPYVSRLVDRFGQLQVALACVTVSAVALVLLVLGAVAHISLVVLTALAAISGVTYPPFGSLVRARWSHILHDPHQLQAAFSLEGILESLTYVSGAVIVTSVAVGVSPVVACLMNAALAFTGGLLLLTDRRTQPETVSSNQQQATGSLLRSGVALITLATFGIGLAIGATEVVSVAFLADHNAKHLTGWILAGWSSGSMLVGLIYGAVRWKKSLQLLFLIAGLLFAITHALFSVVNSVLWLAVVLFVVGATFSPVLINAFGLAKLLAPENRRTEALGWLAASEAIGCGLGASVGGSIVDARGAATAFLVPAAAGVIVLLAALLVPRRRGTSPEEPATVPPDPDGVVTLPDVR